MKPIRVNVTTATDGSGTGWGDAPGGGGVVYAVQLVDGSLDNGVDVTVTSEHADLSIPILVQANFNSDQMVYPRVLEALNTDGSALSSHAMPVVYGRIKVVLASGGAVKTGAVVLYILEA